MYSIHLIKLCPSVCIPTLLAFSWESDHGEAFNDATVISFQRSTEHEVYRTKVCILKSMVFPVVTYGCESRTIKKAERQRTDAFKLWRRLEKTLESPLDSKEIKLVNPKGNQSWIFIGRTDAEAEAPILWPPDTKSWFTGKDPDVRKDWRQEEKGATEDEMVEWNHQFDGHEFEQTLGDSEGQGSLACCSPWGRKE